MEGTVVVIASVVMTDHPAWCRDMSGAADRVVRCGGSVWWLTARACSDGKQETSAAPLAGVGDPPVLSLIDPASMIGPTDLFGPLHEMGSVARWRNPDAWDAVATAVIRQVIRAGHARVLYRSLCRAHGEPVMTPAGQRWLFPAPEVVSGLPDSAFDQLGMAFTRPALRALADAFTDDGESWAGLDPAAFVTRAQTVPRVGPWTAGASVADLTNDYSRYPDADLAVRTWAQRLAPGRVWPDTERDFAAAWELLAGDQVSALTLLTLAWGVQHGRSSDTLAL